MIEAIVFDLDGVLLDSERIWDRARREVVGGHGGHWREEATAAMQGMSSTEWSEYLRTALGVPLSPKDISGLVVENVLGHYGRELPLVPGSTAAVRRMRRWPLAVASSSNRQVIDRVLEMAGLEDTFEATVSSEEVARGKPHPDVYLEAARRLGRSPRRLLAVEDSANGLRSALSAGMTVVAVPNAAYPPPTEVLQRSALVLEGLDGLTVEAVEAIDRASNEGRLDEEEEESFPASDPHADWSGPPD